MAVQKKGKLRRGSIKDKIEKDFISNPDTFADVLNSLLYEGKQVILPENLDPAPTETFYQGTDGLHNQFEDVVMYEKLGCRTKLMYLLANQSKPDSMMLLREAGYIGGAYREQKKRKIKDVYPVIPIVLNWGTKKWSQKRRLKQLFCREQFTEKEWAYIGEQELLVFDMCFLSKEVRERFHSDLRIVVDYLAEGEQALMTDQKVKHKQELVNMICVLSGNADLEDIQKKLQMIIYADEGREEEEKMKDVFTRFEERVEAKSLVKSVESLVKNLHVSLEEACEALEITVKNYEDSKILLNEKSTLDLLSN